MSGSGNYTLTPNLGLYKPVYAADAGYWGTHLNANADTLDSVVGNQPIVNVLNYGAKGDGVTDDTTAIQNTLNTYAGKAIVFVPNTGHPFMTSGLTIPSNTDLLLDGTIMLLPNSPAAVVIVSYASNVTIRGNGAIDGNTSAQATHPGGMAGLGISHSSNVFVTGIQLRNSYHWPLNCSGSSHSVVIDGVSFVGGGAANEFASGSYDCWLTNCTIDGTNNGDYAFCFYGGVHDSGAIGNTIKNAGVNTTFAPPGIGILSDSGQPAVCSNIVIANNVIHDCTGNGISCVSPLGPVQTGIIIANNRCYNNVVGPRTSANVADVYIDNTTHVTITGNQLSNGGSSAGSAAGIFTGPNVTRASIIGNQIYNMGQGSNAGRGLWLGGSHIYVTGNHIYDSQTTPTMQYSVVGGAGPEFVLIGNLFDVPFNLGLAADTVVANTVMGVWTVGSPATFNALATLNNGATIANGATISGSLGVVQSSVLSGTNWQHSGAWIGWNYTVNGMTNFINSRGGGIGGFLFYNVDSSSSATPTLLATLDSHAVLTLAGAGVACTLGGTQRAVVGFDVDATTNALQVYAGGTLRIPTNAANDAAAATAGVPIGGTYRNGSVLQIRVV